MTDTKATAKGGLAQVWAALGRGGKAKVARAVNRSRGAVSQWDLCPGDHVLKVSALSGVPAHVIRPDLYPAPAGEVAA